MYSDRMMQNILKKGKKELEEYTDKRDNYITDRILEGKSIILGPKDLIAYLENVENFKIEVFKFEDRFVGFMFKDGKEFHTLYLADRDENFERFFTRVAKCSTDNFIGFSIYHQGEKQGILGYDVKKFDRDSIKETLKMLFPSSSAMIKSAINDTMQQFTDMVMLDNIIDIASKKKKKIAK